MVSVVLQLPTLQVDLRLRMIDLFHDDTIVYIVVHYCYYTASTTH